MSRGEPVDIRVKAIPGASRDAVAGMLGDRVKVRVSAPPEGGRANKAIEGLIARELGVRPSQVSVVALAGEPLAKADAALIRDQTGFAIGGVAPVGHLNPIRAWVDPRLMEFDRVWAAAGTPHHVFALNPADLPRISGAQPADFVSTLSEM